FTNPAWFSRRGGWLRRDSPKLFARYVDCAATHLGGTIKYWLTINEPTVYVMQGYIDGEWPPCLKSAWIEAAMVFKHLARAHVSAYRVLHRLRGDIRVGFAHSAPVIVPLDPDGRRERS